MGRRVLQGLVNRDGPVVWTGDNRRPPDDVLLGEARRGDSEAFALLYHRYKLDVWHLAWFTLHDHHEAEDAVQETFLKAHRSLGHCRESGSLRPWLLAICRNACRDRLRAVQRRETLPLDDDVAVAPDGGDRERDLDFRRAIAALPEEDREAFLLVDVLGCRSDEAARIAGLRASSTLRSRLARARRALAPAVGEPAAAGNGHAAEVWGLLHSEHHSVVVVATCADGARPLDVADLLREARRDADGDFDLVEFLEALDRRIPGSRRILAVVDDRPPGRAATAAPWLAGHPRWRMQRAPTHASWLGEVEELLGRCGPCSDATRDEVRAALSTSDPFRWTPGP